MIFLKNAVNDNLGQTIIRLFLQLNREFINYLLQLFRSHNHLKLTLAVVAMVCLLKLWTRQTFVRKHFQDFSLKQKHIYSLSYIQLVKTGKITEINNFLRQVGKDCEFVRLSTRQRWWRWQIHYVIRQDALTLNMWGVTCLCLSVIKY